MGAIACRLELQEDYSAKLYVMTVGVLAPFRGSGLGTCPRGRNHDVMTAVFRLCVAAICVLTHTVSLHATAACQSSLRHVMR